MFLLAARSVLFISSYVGCSVVFLLIDISSLLIFALSIANIAITEINIAIINKHGSNTEARPTVDMSNEIADSA